METKPMDPYRGTVESDIEATKRREAEEERLAKMTPLDRAKEKRDGLRRVYEGMCIAATPGDYAARMKAVEALNDVQRRYLDASREVDRLLAARNGGR